MSATTKKILDLIKMAPGVELTIEPTPYLLGPRYNVPSYAKNFTVYAGQGTSPDKVIGFLANERGKGWYTSWNPAVQERQAHQVMADMKLAKTVFSERIHALDALWKYHTDVAHRDEQYKLWRLAEDARYLRSVQRQLMDALRAPGAQSVKLYGEETSRSVEAARGLILQAKAKIDVALGLNHGERGMSGEVTG